VAREHRIEIVHEVSNRPLLMRKTAAVGRLAGAAAAHTICGIPRGWLAGYRAVRRGVHGLDLAIASSETVARELRSAGFPNHKLEVVPLAVRSADFAPSPALRKRASALRRSAGIPRHAPVALFLGPLEERKGPHVFLDAASMAADAAPRAFFVVATSPAYAPRRDERRIRKALGRAGQRLGERLVVVEGIHDVPALATLARVVALPQIGDEAATTPPVTALEAMAAGKPVVMSGTAAADEFISDGRTGALVEPGRPGPLAERLADFLTSPKRAKTVGEAAAEAVREHDLERVTTTVEDLFERVCNERVRGK
jgi:glycosyltransferase involved in cell wall biosynthesis